MLEKIKSMSSKENNVPEKINEATSGDIAELQRELTATNASWENCLSEKEALEKKLAKQQVALQWIGRQDSQVHFLEMREKALNALSGNSDATEELTKLLAAAEQRGRDEARADNGRGFSLWFTREEWGGIIDGLGLEIDRSGQRKSANSESTSDVTSTMCERVIAAIMNASEIHPTAPKVKP